jgi:hypothetical protein
VFGKVVYKRAYYAGCTCQKGQSPVDNQYGIEAGKVTAGLAHLIALSGIKESYDEGRKWLKEYLLFEVSENTVRSETQKMGDLQRRADQELVKAMQDEKRLQQRERSQPAPTYCMGRWMPPRYGLNRVIQRRKCWKIEKPGAI